MDSSHPDIPMCSRPEMYLLGDASSQCGTEMDDRSRAELVEEFFSSTGVGAPEVEGQLWLKAEGKKTWKKFHFVLRSSGLYYAPKGKKTSKDLVCLATFDVNQAKNPKYIRYLCADNEDELNKWVTGIRIAKYGRTLYENYRGIIEDIAHDDIDRLASARLSVGSNGQPASCKPPPHSIVSLADQKLTPLRSETVRTPDSSDNKSFDSALQMSDGIEVSSKKMIFNGSNTVVGRSPASNLSSRSTSSGSLSEKSSSALSSVELGFNCDSPEGGTIRKKPPAILNLKTGQVKSDESQSKKSQQQKEVRFKETFTTIPEKRNNVVGAPGYLPSPPPELYESSEENGDSGGGPLYQSLVEVLTLGRNSGKKKAIEQDSTLYTKPPQRHFSQESLASNPAMLHSATLIRSDEDALAVAAVPSSPVTKKSTTQSSTSSIPSPAVQSKELLSPQPSRPAPVLKPAVGRKPSLDKSFLLRKQLVEERSNVTNNSNNHNMNNVSKPTYEETLRKCQSLTRHHSSPTPGSALTSIDASSPPTISRQNSCPEAPSIPPKPVINLSKIAHLPPSGIQSRFRPNSHQNQQLNSNFLNDLHRALSQKVETESDLKFPNRLSSGEYENVGLSDSNRAVKVHPRPPLPKRSEETHLTWKRS